MSIFGRSSGGEPRITYERFDLSAGEETFAGEPAARGTDRLEPRVDRSRFLAPAQLPGTGMMLIAADSELEGRLRSRGVIRVEGVVRGDLTAPVVLLEAGGLVEGRIETERLRVSGTLRGTVEAREIEVVRTALLEAELSYEEIGIERGARVRGLHRQRDPEPAPAETETDARIEAEAVVAVADPSDPSPTAEAVDGRPEPALEGEAVPLASAIETAALVAEAEAALQDLAEASKVAAAGAALLAEEGVGGLMALEADLRAVPERLLLDKPAQ